jgi:hypothetical protein
VRVHGSLAMINLADQEDDLLLPLTEVCSLFHMHVLHIILFMVCFYSQMAKWGDKQFSVPYALKYTSKLRLYRSYIVPNISMDFEGLYK